MKKHKRKKDQFYGILFNRKNEWNNAIFIMANGSRDYHTKSGRERQTLYDMTFTIWYGNDTNGLFTKQKQTHRHRK